MLLRSSHLASSSPLMLAVLFLAASAAAQGNDLTTPEIVARMAQAQQQSRQQAPAYVAERQYHVYKEEGAKAKSDSEITAEISFLPPGDKSFAIKKSSGGMAENVVRKALEHESSMARNPGVSGMTTENYHFDLVGKAVVDGRPCYVLTVTPRRETKDLIHGYIWVDAQRFLVRRAEGKPAKNPSWWVKDVTVKVEYNDVNGVWLQTASTATAKIRFAGDYTLNSQHVRLQRAEVSASVSASSLPGAPRSRSHATNDPHHSTSSNSATSSKSRILRTEQGLATFTGRP